jgi:lipoprotein NlpD
VVVAIALSGCIPRSASVPPAATVPPPPYVATTTGPRLDLDLSKLSDAPPAWEMRPVIAGAVAVAAARYVVKPGDTLRAIGETTGAGSDAIVRANGLIAPFRVKPGQTLAVPGGRYHRVRAGETGIAIARAYGTAWSGIVAANALTEPFVLRVGQRLVLPATASVTATAINPEARAAAFQIGIDDVLTGSEPARAAAASPVPSAVTPPAAITPATRFSWPADGALAGRFGKAGSGRANQGIDIAVTAGAGVRAASSGVVAYVGSGVPGYGGLILIRHDGDWISAYGRIANASVAKGDTVKSGQMLGRSGTEPLHFELRRARVPVDPLTYLSKR